MLSTILVLLINAPDDETINKNPGSRLVPKDFLNLARTHVSRRSLPFLHLNYPIKVLCNPMGLVLRHGLCFGRESLLWGVGLFRLLVYPTP